MPRAEERHQMDELTCSAGTELGHSVTPEPETGYGGEDRYVRTVTDNGCHAVFSRSVKGFRRTAAGIRQRTGPYA